MRTAIVLLTRDLRVRDHPALAATCANADRVVPLFVLDPRLQAISANRTRFLHQALIDLRQTLRGRGGDLVVRHGDPVAETIRVARAVAAEGVAITADISGYARSREHRLAQECTRHRIAMRTFPGVTVVEPGAIRPAGGGDHYRVFSPYHRAWQAASWRGEVAAPRAIRLPEGLDPGELPPAPPAESPDAVPGGETAGLRRMRAWLTGGDGRSSGVSERIPGYADHHDDLAADETSRLSPYLRFGCVSPLTLANAARALDGPGPDAFVRQLCWRDFYHQVAHAFPRLATDAYRAPAEPSWRRDADALRHWQDGRTGVPVVDAGMRQLRAEGWMHNRARLITSAHLTKHLGLDWRDGVRWYFRWLLDGDIANNAGNWQWVAGTGNDTRPYRRFNPIRQAHRFDPEGAYVRRYLPELAAVPGGAVHEPWRLPGPMRRDLDYPPPLESPGEEPTWLRA
ncbi:cryptochrome/photolyase family protein [Krasilnikovia sp. MM14-A1004]|uniref:cryptochrome/photolyase family protein n=1 Tax=Krasilnikovia sp. MM14-A1004 TaxID=3373541 RepID=UPI00399CBFDE